MRASPACSRRPVQKRDRRCRRARGPLRHGAAGARRRMPRPRRRGSRADGRRGRYRPAPARRRRRSAPPRCARRANRRERRRASARRIASASPRAAPAARARDRRSREHRPDERLRRRQARRDAALGFAQSTGALRDDAAHRFQGEDERDEHGRERAICRSGESDGSLPWVCLVRGFAPKVGRRRERSRRCAKEIQSLCDPRN